ncbi:16S rRNA (guanine(966)-N(2))-methyltransferase RsmD [Nocardioides ungokensis]|uniref:16S rRNA (guanine(966)-N(2))-methyltransferase RsmD n=1 Tax=Nocardioides ungokensis TaxID=1643322 RepID=UPI0015DF8895|nr:16S rRNA (guanine(966)-N(2))-methyltransferase RsmD [Nocardioides ungokensis]
MTRIIGGAAGGRRIATPRGASTRPTSDRVREALFSAVESWCGSLRGLRFLDLYAGSGAVGLEAWSRGAGVVTLVEQDRRTAALISANARALGFARANVLAASVAGTLRRSPAAPYDVVFLDPPYPLADSAVADDLAALARQAWLVPGALVVVERSTRSPEPVWPDGFSATREKRYGETVLWYGHAASTPAPEE